MTLLAEEISPAEVHDLSERFEATPLEGVLGWAWERFGARAAIGTSFQGAGLVMIHHAVSAGLPLPVFTLDTQLLFPETLELKRRLENFFEIKIESIYPEQTPEEQAAEHGPALWDRFPDLCCTMRKVIPLQKKMEQLAVWVTGLRRQQSETRQKTGILELYHFDVLRDQYILKLNPMANWSREAIWAYIAEHKIPYNPLHDRGYRSIGCQPCTRAVGEGVNERAGRWTGFDKSECGIHTFLGEQHMEVSASDPDLIPPTADFIQRRSIPRTPAFFPKKIARDDDSHLDALEAQSIFLLREAYHHFKKLCMPWSMGKDSNVLIWLAKKAFCGHIPFPLLHIDTTYEFPGDAGIPRLGGEAIRAESDREDQRGRTRGPGRYATRGPSGTRRPTR